MVDPLTALAMTVVTDRNMTCHFQLTKQTKTFSLNFYVNVHVHPKYDLLNYHI